MTEYSVSKKQQILEFICSNDFINHRMSARDLSIKLNIEIGEAELTIFDLKYRGFIEIRETMSRIEYGKDFIISRNNSAFGFLKFGGYEQELKDYKLKEQEVLSVIKTNRIQKITIIITTAIIGFGLLVQIFTWVLFRQQIEFQEQQIELEKKKSIKDSLDKSDMIKELNSILKKDTLKVSLIKR